MNDEVLCVAQAGQELETLLHLSCWDCRHVPPHLVPSICRGGKCFSYQPVSTLMAGYTRLSCSQKLCDEHALFKRMWIIFQTSVFKLGVFCFFSGISWPHVPDRLAHSLFFSPQCRAEIPKYTFQLSFFTLFFSLSQSLTFPLQGFFEPDWP